MVFILGNCDNKTLMKWQKSQCHLMMQVNQALVANVGNMSFYAINENNIISFYHKKI